jgi:hypothetical protein
MQMARSHLLTRRSTTTRGCLCTVRCVDGAANATHAFIPTTHRFSVYLSLHGVHVCCGSMRVSTTHRGMLFARQMGVSRSATAVLAWCISHKGWSLDEAYAYVKKRRGVVKPNRWDVPRHACHASYHAMPPCAAQLSSLWCHVY